MVDDFASFPNSRIKPRQATTQAFTRKIQVNHDGEASGTILDDGGEVTVGGNTLVLAADPNLTYMFMRNPSKTSRLFYSYEDKADMISGEQEEAGNFLEPGEGIDIEYAPVYARAEGGERINVTIDYGIG